MRDEAKKIYKELEAGKSVGQIKANPKTKAKVNKMFLYRQLIDSLIEDIQIGHYTFSTYDIQNMLKRKNKDR